jgi:hypothetical protein
MPRILTVAAIRAPTPIAITSTAIVSRAVAAPLRTLP